MSREPGKNRVRLDVLLVERGLAPTRQKAQAMILAGLVSSEGRRWDKAGASVAIDAPLAVAAGRQYVGRGAGKLAPALSRFAIEVAGRDAMDVGASTGGFTQVLLERHAARVIAVDVGRGQLDWTLRNDPRVTLMEGVNARYLDPDSLPFRPSIATIDVSFISLQQVLEPACSCLAPGGDVVALAKPQFEVGRTRVGRGGIVRDPALWDEVLAGLTRFAVDRGLGPTSIARSALPGAEGNVEFFIHLRPSSPPSPQPVLDALRHEAVHGPTP